MDHSISRCVIVQVVSTRGAIGNVENVWQLCKQLLGMNAQRRMGKACSAPTCMLLTAGPAAGKTVRILPWLHSALWRL